VCCVLDSLVWVLGCEFVLFVGEFGARLWELFCAVCGRLLCRYGGVSM